MNITAQPAAAEEIRSWRELYRAEMNCQIIHDSLHSRKGWTTTYKLLSGATCVGYGAVVTGGPWAGRPALFEFYVARGARHRMADLFEKLAETSRPETIETQSNDPLLTPMLLLFGRNPASESILFRDETVTNLTLANGTFRQATGDDATKIFSVDREPGSEWVIEIDGQVAATGGLLFHYNPPYGDIWMEVGETYRRRGLGAYMVQELKRVCHGMGRIPGARCKTQNAASRRTLMKAGMAPCGHLLKAEFRVR